MNINDDKQLVEMYKTSLVSLREELNEKNDYIHSLEESLNCEQIGRATPEKDLYSMVKQVSGTMDLYRYLCANVPGIECGFNGTHPVRYTIQQPGRVSITGVGTTALEAFVEAYKKFMLQFGESINPETGQPEKIKRLDVPDAF